MAALLNEAPTDNTLRLQMGFIYKTISQVPPEPPRCRQGDTWVGACASAAGRTPRGSIRSRSGSPHFTGGNQVTETVH